MADIEMNNNEEFENLIEGPIVLVDDDTGEEIAFEVIESANIEGQSYVALVPANDEDAEEYVILKIAIDGEDMVFTTVDDDDEADRVEDYFNDLLFNEIDYDE